jgi:RecA/RadA recombinase
MKRGTSLEKVPGIGKAIAKKLMKAGIYNVDVLAYTDSNSLWEQTRIYEDKCRKFIEAARELLGYNEFRTGPEQVKWEGTRMSLSTGLEFFDEKLMGGFEIGSLVEFNGSATTGKTQMCHHLSVMAQLPESKGGIDSSVLWLDADRSYRTVVIHGCALRFGIEPDYALSRVFHQEVIDRSHLMRLIHEIPRLVIEEGVRLVVIDNLMTLFQIENRSEWEKSQLIPQLAEVLTVLRGLARSQDILIIYTNQVYPRPGIFALPNHPMGGHLMAHSCDYRFSLKNDLRDRRKLILRDHVCIPKFEGLFEIGWGGIYEHAKAKRDHELMLKDFIRGLSSQSLASSICDSAMEV